MEAPRALAVVGTGPTAVETATHAYRETRDTAAELDRAGRLAVAVVGGPDGAGTAADIEASVTAEAGTALRVETVVVDADPADPAALVAALSQFAPATAGRVVLDPELGVPVEALRSLLGDEAASAVEVAPVVAPPRRSGLLHAGGLRRVGTLFVLTYGFYLAVGGFSGLFDVVTGAATAAVVAVAFGRVSLEREPRARRTLGRLGRALLALPLLLWEVAKANVVLAYLILHPSLPVEPGIETVETDTRDDLERMVLANATTLTPGTLVVDVRGREFEVHSLTPGARGTLSEGRVGRLVAFVFGRDPNANGATDADSPEDRGE
jgi:multicomponent Na+:H+ antiporter subunit E